MHDYCAIYDALPTPLLYVIHHTILVIAKGPPPPPTHTSNLRPIHTLQGKLVESSRSMRTAEEEALEGEGEEEVVEEEEEGEEEEEEATGRVV